MTTAPPIPCVYVDKVFRPLKSFARVAEASYGDGEIVALVPHQERSDKSHRHYFAMIKEAWENLPEDEAERHASPEHLRKWALIKAGFYDERTVVCASHAEAMRWAPIMAGAVDFSVVLPRGTVVTIYTAKSQSMRAMGKTLFQQSKEAVLRIVADLIKVEPAALEERARQVA